MKSIKFASWSTLVVLIFLLLISSYPRICYSFCFTKKDNLYLVQDNSIIKIEYKMEPGRGGLINGKWRSYEQDTAAIKKSIEDRIKKTGYQVVTNGSNYEYLLKIKYFERVSSIPQWGDTVYIFSFVLEHKNGDVILNSGEEETYQWGEKENFNYAYIEKLIDAAIMDKDIFPLYKSLLDERRFMNRIIKLLPNYKDPRAIELLVPLLRDTSESVRRFTRQSLARLSYKPESENEKLALAIVEAREHWDFNRPKQVVLEYGMPAVELYLEDLKIQAGNNADSTIKTHASTALQAAQASINKEWNEYVITKMIEVLKTEGEGVINKRPDLGDATSIQFAKLFYMVDAIGILAEIGDERVLEVLKSYVNHPLVGDITFKSTRGQGKLIVDRINYLEKKLKRRAPEKKLN